MLIIPSMYILETSFFKMLKQKIIIHIILEILKILQKQNAEIKYF